MPNGTPDPRDFRALKRPTARAAKAAKRLRRETTPPERVLWSRLKRRQLDGLRFRRQHPLGPYVADFYCHDARLIVEVDGRSHQGERIDRDRDRDDWMADLGILTLRYSARQVTTETAAVLEHIRRVALARIDQRPD